MTVAGRIAEGRRADLHLAPRMLDAIFDLPAKYAINVIIHGDTICQPLDFKLVPAFGKPGRAGRIEIEEAGIHSVGEASLKMISCWTSCHAK